MNHIRTRNCKLGIRCSKDWNDLIPTDSKAIRYCEDCDSEVHWCADGSELLRAIGLNRCIAFNMEIIDGVDSRDSDTRYVGMAMPDASQEDDLLQLSGESLDRDI